jgi:hypothetical protein
MTKRALTICGLFCALMIGVAAASAQKGANFAGEWELDKAKSKLSHGDAATIECETWTVTQDEKQLTRDTGIERAEGAQGSRCGRRFGIDAPFDMDAPLTVRLDGGETVKEWDDGKSTTNAKWLNKGKTLEVNIVIVITAPRGGATFQIFERWELADSGKTLQIHRKAVSRLGEDESTWALTRK